MIILSALNTNNSSTAVFLFLQLHSITFVTKLRIAKVKDDNIACFFMFSTALYYMLLNLSYLYSKADRYSQSIQIDIQRYIIVKVDVHQVMNY